MSTFKEDIIKTHVQTEWFQKVQADILATQKRLAEYSEEIKEPEIPENPARCRGKKESAEYKNINAGSRSFTVSDRRETGLKISCTVRSNRPSEL